MNIRKAVKMMGYRLPDRRKNPNRYCKPFGYSMLMVDIMPDSWIISQRFFGASGDLLCWSSKETDLNEDSVDLCVKAISYYEAYSTKNPLTYISENFGFLSQEEIIEDIIG